jgi:hypothetical protein
MEINTLTGIIIESAIKVHNAIELRLLRKSV